MSFGKGLKIVVALSELKVFADDNLIVAQMVQFLLTRNYMY